ncbi:thiamine pyrophosphokinase [Paenibacillus curdlanolyticus YK9]|uniref:Thiamine diphosphokinase n=1 Tax=Paenibacillus curdlanolyticus YK9 TaxID=717606 RepID=E0I560_9BACL|nr:thiamine diphosphokinase [Paenibacillus curdlanolyticus]EFM12102.1 thiamine pyrophosphokinase [Paenibacillus curdlanolyticus YK9]
MKSSCIAIVTGGSIGDWAHPYLAEADFRIGADKGAQYILEHGFKLDQALGDFDSIDSDVMQDISSSGAIVQTFDAIDKDYTDTELAVRYALQRQPKRIILLGALGTRFDHMLANVHLLKLAMDAGVEAVIEDRYNTIRLHQPGAPMTVKRSRHKQVSLLPLTSEVHGITLNGFQYPLTNATLTIGQSLGISNVLDSSEGTVQITQGLLLIIESHD